MKRSFAFTFVGALSASACSGSESGVSSGASGGAPDASVASGGNGTSSGGRSTGTGGRNTGGGGSSSTGGLGGATGGASSGTGGGGSGAADASSSSGGTSGSGGAGGGSGGNGANDAGSGSCGGDTCAATEVCVAYRTIGGGMIRPNDAGTCPPGSHVEQPSSPNPHCAADFRYRCVPLVGCAGADVRCSCATGTCPSQYFACSDTGPAWVHLDPVAELICQQLAP